MMAFYDSAHVANVGKLVRAAQSITDAKDRSKYLDTLRAISTTVVPEDVWRDVLVIAYDHLLDTTVATDGVGARLNELLATAFPDSGFSVIASKKDDYTSMQLSTLETIASACPYEYGIGVYMARTLLAERDTVLYLGINDCEKAPQSASERRGNEEQEDEVTNEADGMAFGLYPNPNAGEFTIVLNMDENNIAEMNIWSITGQAVHFERLSTGTNRLMLQQANGLYLYRVTVNGEPEWSGKISISAE